MHLCAANAKYPRHVLKILNYIFIYKKKYLRTNSENNI